MDNNRSVAHIMIPYIRPTETFIYDRITNHISYRPFVITDEPPVNTSQYPFPDIRTLADRPLLERKYDALMKKTISTSPFLTGELKKSSPSVAHAHYGTVGLAALPSCSESRVPLIVSFYGIDASALLGAKAAAGRYRELFQKAAAVSVLSEDMKNRLAAHGCAPEKLFVHHLAVDTAAMTPSTRAKDGPVVIVSVGRLVPKKGMDMLIEAFSRITGKSVEAALHIYGDGPLENDIRRLVSEKKLEKSVTLHGGRPRSEVISAIKEADIFALFSNTGPDGDMEGTPTVLIEAGALGVPSVSTLHAGIPEVVTHNKTGLLCGEKDIEAFAENLSSLAQNPSLRAEMGAAARSHICERFDIRAVMSEIESLYDKVYRP